MVRSGRRPSVETRIRVRSALSGWRVPCSSDTARDFAADRGLVLACGTERPMGAGIQRNSANNKKSLKHLGVSIGPVATASRVLASCSKAVSQPAKDSRATALRLRPFAGLVPALGHHAAADHPAADQIAPCPCAVGRCAAPDFALNAFTRVDRSPIGQRPFPQFNLAL